MTSFLHFQPANRNFLAKKTISIFCLLALLLVSACSPTDKKWKYTIGFSQCTLVNQWRQTMLDGMQRELAFHPEVNFIYRDANGNSQKQIEQIEELIELGVDLLIVSPQEAAPITRIVEDAYQKGIKVIVVDRKTLSDNYTAYVGASNYEVGGAAASFANSLLKGKGNVLEVSDIPGSSADIERHKGFTDMLENFPGMQLVSKVYEEGDENPSNKNVTELLSKNPDIQLIFAQNDRLAYSAYNACKNLGLDKQVKIIGVDGLLGENGGIDLVEKGILKGTVLYPTGGEEAILTAMQVLENKPFKKETGLSITVIDSSNVRIMKLQAEKMLAQQKNIDRSQRTIEEQAAITRSQTNTIYTISLLFLLAIILAGTAWFYLRENRKITKQLEAQNQEILHQQRRLIEMSAKAREASEAKFNFFTNISHEFRTPLTLIMAPLEEMMTNSKLQSSSRTHVQMIQRNVIRLLRMVNQLIDFRKIELNKMEVKASKNDLVEFTREIMHAFDETAHKKGIDLRFFTTENELPVWFDVNMLDKVLYNLLSNALKFTRDDGFIHLSIEKTADGKHALLKVKDNGIGMNQEAVNHAFDLFYQGGYETYRGSGIGLSLCKELVILHHGNIQLVSETGKGTTFIVELLMGNEHLLPEQIVTELVAPVSIVNESSEMYTADLVPSLAATDDETPATAHDFTLVIIEDNTDLLHFMSMRLSKKYNVIMVENGFDAIEKVFEELPDLIISDVMMPGKDGLELTRLFKSDVRTAHIPIILLTAKTAVGQQVEGYSSLADAYITKPFNVEILENNIKSLLLNRQKMKDHFTAESPLDAKSQGFKKSDRRFVTDFSALVEANIANENFMVEDICSQLGISRVQLYRKVKTLLNCNVNEYILNIRLQKAKYYLQHEHLPVSEVSYKVGFSSASYFSTVFRSRFDISPKEFREIGMKQK
jgi:signal transduction histidine kinase/DNA-binding response OmpR family regulator